MGDSFVVDVSHSGAYLSQEPNCFGFFKEVFVAQVLKQGTALQVLEDDVNVVAIAEQPVELHDVGVANEGVNLDLLGNLGVHLVFPYLLLAKAF